MKHHEFIATITSGFLKQTIRSEYLAEVTKKARKSMKLCHGNHIRTALIEEGEFNAEGFGRRGDSKFIMHSINIEVRRWES